MGLNHGKLNKKSVYALPNVIGISYVLKEVGLISFKISFRDHEALHMFELNTNENMCVVGVMKLTNEAYVEHNG